MRYVVLWVLAAACAEAEALPAAPAAQEAPVELRFASAVAEVAIGEEGGPLQVPAAPAPIAAAPPAAEPKRAPSTAEGEGLPAETVQAVIKARTGQVKACYERELKQNPSLRGKVRVAFTITPSGSVRSTEIVQNTTRSADLSPCVRKAVSGWRFPTAAGSTDVEYPFTFRPSEDF
jgi:TonB family protein